MMTMIMCDNDISALFQHCLKNIVTQKNIFLNKNHEKLQNCPVLVILNYSMTREIPALGGIFFALRRSGAFGATFRAPSVPPLGAFDATFRVPAVPIFHRLRRR